MVGISYAPTLAAAAGPSPETLALQQAYAKQLLAGDDQPIHSWSQGLSGIVDALVGGTMLRKAGERQTSAENAANDQFAQLLTGGSAYPAGGGMVPGAAPIAQAPPSPDTGLAAPASAASGGIAPAVATPAAVGAPAVDPGRMHAALAILRNPYASAAQKAIAAKMLMPDASESYTLKPGEHRFAGGREIASVPDAAPEKWVDLPPDANGAVYQRSELTGAIREGIKGSTPGDKWTDLPPDAQGNVLQRNERTGEVKQAVAGDVKSPTAFNQAKELAVAGHPVVAIDQRAESAEASARGGAIVGHFKTLAEDLPAADQLIQGADQLEVLLKGVDTGSQAGVRDWLRKNTGIALGDNADKLQAVSSLVDYMAPRMRVPGSGSSSDTDVAMFKAALPSLMGTPGGNQLVIDTVRSMAEHRLAIAQISEDYLTGAVESKDALAKMRSLDDPLAAFKKAAAVAPPAATPPPAAVVPSSAPAAAKTPPPAGWGPEWDYLTPDEQATALAKRRSAVPAAPVPADPTGALTPPPNWGQ